jgi:F-type H+-transporting ATPase subunit gamma
MESVSAVKMRKSQERALASRAYAHAAARILEHVSKTQEETLRPYTRERSEGKLLLVLVTSDKGLAGGVNSAVLKEAERFAAGRPCDTICIGRKAVEFANAHLGGELIAEYTNVSDELTLEDAEEMTEHIIERFKNGEYREVHVGYQSFVSTFEQKPRSQKLLPLDPAVLEEVVNHIRPARGRYADDTSFMWKGGNYHYEPGAEEVLHTLIPRLVTVMIFHALVESKAAEHSARMVAMKGATDKAKEIIRELTIRFNKERQSVITREVSEITGGIEAMKKK